MDLLSLGTLPIDPDSPGGSDVRYESSFEELQAEVDKLSLPSASGEVIDWQKVSDLAAAILAEEAKDLLVAAYFGVARIHLEQYQGLQQALQLFADLLENFWDTLFPKKKRMRGRLAAVEWGIEKRETAREKLHDVSMAEEEKIAHRGW
jgi:type VI secretion system protein VasJ